MSDDGKSAQDDDRTVDIHYIKPTAFREAGCDGVIGGSTPQGKLWLAFYSERYPLPRVMRQKLVPVDGEKFFQVDPDTPATVVESRSGVIRSVEFGVYLSVDTAKELRSFLERYIAEAEQVEEK